MPPESNKQNRTPTRSILCRLVAKRQQGNRPVRQNFQPNFGEEERPTPSYCPDYKRIAFFRRMKLAMKRTSTRQVLALEPVHHVAPPTFCTKLYGEFSIAPWQTPEELRCDVLPS